MTLVQMNNIQTTFVHMNMTVSIALWWKQSRNKFNCQICGNE